MVSAKPEQNLEEFLEHGSDFEIGETLESVKRILGKPAAENGSKLKYEAAEGGATAAIYVAGGKVRKIEWSFHPD